MIKIKTSRSVLALMAILFGFIFGLYVWAPNTQPISAEEEDNTNIITPLIFNFTLPEVNITKSEIKHVSPETDLKVLGLSIEKYRSVSKNGPWDEGDDLLGRIDVTPNGETFYIYYKVVLNNTCDVDLILTYADIYDGLELNLEQILGYSLPSMIKAGESIDFSYKLAAYEGVHANIIYVEGSYGEDSIEVYDVALYDGYRPEILSKSNFRKDIPDEEIPNFVVPEYNLGVLGGLGGMMLAYIYSSYRKRQSFFF